MTPSDSAQQQVRATDEPTEPGAGPDVASSQVQATGVDDILDEIDAVIGANAAAFVQGFVQKGGQ